MRKHSGMRPHDIAVLLKILLLENKNWNTLTLANSLKISQSEISESLNRSRIAGLITPDKKEVMRNSFLEFLIYGLKYVFPALPGKISRGIVTAHSAEPIRKFIIQSDDVYVWEYDDGDVKGQSVEPLYKNAALAAMEDKQLYEMLALIDVVRTGNAREFKLSIEELTERIQNDNGKYN